MIYVVWFVLSIYNSLFQVSLSLKVGFQYYLTTSVAGFSCNFFQRRVLEYILSFPSLPTIPCSMPHEFFYGLQYHILYSVSFQESKYTEVLQEGRPLPRPETGLLSNTWKWMSEETRVLTKQETLLGKGTWVESRRGREPRKTALPHGLQCLVLW